MKNSCTQVIVINFMLFILFVIPIIGQEMPDQLSLITTKVILQKGNEPLTQGTGFYFAKVDTLNSGFMALITNYHVLTGAAPKENKTPIGDNILIYFHKNLDSLSDLKEVRLPLFTKSGKPVWISSSKYPNADIAVIPIPTDAIEDCERVLITEEWTKQPAYLRPTSSITLIGYPYGISDTVNNLPIWKTGSIASEPNYDFNGEPSFLLDISAFPGMSGSPAFIIDNNSGSYEISASGIRVSGKLQKFIGVYASMEMLSEDKYLEQLNMNGNYGIKVSSSLELGRIWKADIIIDIVNSIIAERYETEILNDF